MGDGAGNKWGCVWFFLFSVITTGYRDAGYGHYQCHEQQRLRHMLQPPSNVLDCDNNISRNQCRVHMLCTFASLDFTYYLLVLSCRNAFFLRPFFSLVTVYFLETPFSIFDQLVVYLNLCLNLFFAWILLHILLEGYLIITWSDLHHSLRTVKWEKRTLRSIKLATELDVLDTSKFKKFSRTIFRSWVVTWNCL